MRIMRRERAAKAVRWGRRSRGFTLVEIMVGLTILLIAMAGLVPLFIAGFDQSSLVRYKSTATNIAKAQMESIRQLDYRDIPSDTDDEGTVTNEGKTYLTGKFGGDEEVRGVIYTIDYGVETIGYGPGALKEVSVTVSWTAPPNVSPVMLTTMFHQQYNGLRISRMEVHQPDPIDDIYSAFDQLPKDSTPYLYVFIAEDDWDLAVDNLNEATMSVKPGVFMKYDVVDSVGASTLDEATREQKITYLDWDDSTGTVTDVWFRVQLDVASIPDGYWDVNAWAYNQYEEPGNRWTLRFLVENGNPDAPSNLVGEAQSDNESIKLNWSGTPDTDRDYYVIERRGRAYSEGVGWGLWSGWQALTDEFTGLPKKIDPADTSLMDEGNTAAEKEPFGTETKPREYLYRIYAVDKLGNKGAVYEMPLAEAVLIPSGVVVPTTTPTTTPTTETSTTLAAIYTLTVESLANKQWEIEITYPGSTTPDIKTTLTGINTISFPNLPAGTYHCVATTNSGNLVVIQDVKLGPGQTGLFPIGE